MKLRYVVAAMALFVVTACVDKNLQLDKVSTEVAIGGDVTTLPIGYLDKQTLGDIINLEDTEGMTVDEDGNYSLAFAGDGDEITIAGIENKFSINKTVTTFSTEYPEFDITGEKSVIDDPFTIIPHSIIDDAHVDFVHGVVIPIPDGGYIKAKEEGEVTHELKYTVPEYLAAVKRIYLKPQNTGDKGAAIHLTLMLHDIATVNGGGHVTLQLDASDDYELYNHNGEPLKELNHEGHTTTYEIAKEYEFAAGTEEVDFTIYLNSIANDSKVQDGILQIPMGLGYHLSFDIRSSANTVICHQMPELHIRSELQYQDADIVLNKVSLLEHGSMADNATAITLDNMPKEVKSIQKVNFSDHSPMHLLAEGLDWLEDVTAEHIIIEAQLPDYLTLHDDKQHGYDAATHTLRTSLSDLRHKLHINLDALTFEGEGIKPQDGALTLNFAPDIAAYIEEGTEAKLSSILHDKAITFSTGFDDTTLELVSLEGQVAYKYEEHTTIQMRDGEEDVDFSISNAGLSPVITLNINNPLTLGAMVSAQLTPIIDGEANIEHSVAVNNVEIKAATMVDGSIQNASTTIILADESMRENYTSAEYTFVACDLGELLVQDIPDDIKLDVVFSTDDEASQVIYVTDSSTLSYSYDVSIPLVFESGLEISIEETSDGLADTFADLSEHNITLGDVSLVLDAVNTIPLDFQIEAEFLDAEGRPTAATLDIPESNNTLKGSADGKSEEKSTLRLGLGLGEDGNIRQLADVDALRFKLTAKRSHQGSVALNAAQYISLKIKLEVKGKINIDLDNI